jgi:hypothetical protein
MTEVKEPTLRRRYEKCKRLIDAVRWGSTIAALCVLGGMYAADSGWRDILIVGFALGIVELMIRAALWRKLAKELLDNAVSLEDVQAAARLLTVELVNGSHGIGVLKPD